MKREKMEYANERASIIIICKSKNYFRIFYILCDVSPKQILAHVSCFFYFHLKFMSSLKLRLWCTSNNNNNNNKNSIHLRIFSKLYTPQIDEHRFWQNINSNFQIRKISTNVKTRFIRPLAKRNEEKKNSKQKQTNTL